MKSRGVEVEKPWKQRWLQAEPIGLHEVATPSARELAGRLDWEEA